MIVVYLLDVPENGAIVEAAARSVTVRVSKSGCYFQLTSEREIVITREITGCRYAVWFSAIAGISRNCRITRYDKELLCMESIPHA